MARIMEPLLWRNFPHTTSGAAAVDAVDIDLDITIRDAIELIKVMFWVSTEYTTVINSIDQLLIARPDAQNAVTSSVEATEDPDMIAHMHVNQAAVLTSGFSRDPGDHQLQIDMPRGLIIARRMTYMTDFQLANARGGMQLWYRRVELDANEIVALVALRR